MRSDATFIGIEVDDAVVGDAALAARLEEVCPVDIFAVSAGAPRRVTIVEENIDECVLCRLCLDASPDEAVKVHKLYSDEPPLT